MKKMFFFLGVFISLTALAESKKISIYIELKGWPDSLQANWQTAINELIHSESCYDEKRKVINDDSLFCHKFDWFESVEQLKPYSRQAYKKKLVLIYDRKNIDSAKVQIYKWDGQKLQRIRNSGGNYASKDLKDFIVGWSFK